jgi:uroporphyrinogen III methyltransferase/synthase
VTGKGPLAGKTVVVTRTKAQAAELARALEAAGAEVLAFPVIETVDPESWHLADEAVRNLERYAWIVFTSANAVERFFGRLGAQGMDARALSGSRIAAVGPATAKRLASHGISPDFVPEEDFRAEGLVGGFVSHGLQAGSRVLIPRALEAREILPETLRAAGALVDVVPVYRTVRAEPDAAALARLREGVDAVTFTSSSTVRHFLALAGAEALERAVVASIGPVTSATLRDAGVRVDVEPAESTVPALAEALARRFGGA